MKKDFKTSLDGKLVLVTGAGRGIGRAMALAFARRGCRLAICSLHEEKIQETAKMAQELGAEVFAAKVDVKSESDCLSFIAETERELGLVEILINNAGIFVGTPLEEQSSASWQEVLDTNLNSAFYFCRSAIAGMKKSGWGRIINISSVSGKQGEMNAAAYSASKFAMIGMSQSLALELASSGITVNAICPGWVETDMSKGQLSCPPESRHESGNFSLSAWEIARLSVPQERFIQAEEVADLAIYLASDSGQGITGQAINICGGLCLS